MHRQRMSLFLFLYVGLFLYSHLFESLSDGLHLPDEDSGSEPEDGVDIVGENMDEYEDF